VLEDGFCLAIRRSAGAYRRWTLDLYGAVQPGLESRIELTLKWCDGQEAHRHRFDSTGRLGIVARTGG
jgi:hypothetical protein